MKTSIKQGRSSPLARRNVGRPTTSCQGSTPLIIFCPAICFFLQLRPPFQTRRLPILPSFVQSPPQRRQRDPLQTTPRPPRIPALVHLPAPDSLAIVRPQPHHRLHPFGRLLPFRPNLPGRAALRLARRIRRSCRMVWGAPNGCEGGDEVSDRATVHLS